MMDWPVQPARWPRRPEQTDVVDACVTEGPCAGDLVVSSDSEDLKALAAAANRHLEGGAPLRPVQRARRYPSRRMVPAHLHK